tara:strand:+ start:553 stop:678 length:126 start_codon:yes stop_codon:yes gene_type:complete
LEIAKAIFIDDKTEKHLRPHLKRMGYDKAETVEERFYGRGY